MRKLNKSMVVLLSLALTLGLFPTVSAPVRAEESVNYVDRTWSGAAVEETAGSCDSYTVVTSTTTAWTAGWYVVRDTVTISDAVTVSGTVNLILCDGGRLTALAGINVPGGAALTVFGQSGGTGALLAGCKPGASGLTATIQDTRAGIGGTAGSDCGAITICGGLVYALGGETASGIGAGLLGNGGAVTIYGGTVNAGGMQGGVAIGGSYSMSGMPAVDGGTITIYGGTVNADGQYGAAIGCGTGAVNTTVNIYGGTVTADGNQNKYGIGVEDGAVNIYGGNITAIGNLSSNGNGIAGTVTVTGGAVSATGTGAGNGITGDVTFTSGTVSAVGGGSGKGIAGDVSLDWTNLSDRVYASSYEGTVTLAKAFSNGTTVIPRGEFVYAPALIDAKTLAPANIAVDLGITGGAVTASAHYAEAGDTVTLTVTPALGYGLDALTVLQGGTAVTVTDNSFVMPAGEVTVSATFEALPPVFGNHALVLSGEIGVKFRVAFPEGFDPTGCRMDFTAADGGRLSVAYADAETITNSTDRYFTYYVNALELADTVTATLHYGGDRTVVNEYSVMAYIAAARQELSSDGDLMDLVDALHAYGYYMQHSGWTDNKQTHATIPAPSEPLDDDSVDAARTGVESKAVVKEDASSVLADAKFSLTLNEKTVINITVKPAAGVLITSGGYKTRDIGGETYYQFSTAPIGAGNLGTAYTITVVTDHGEATVTASAMSYVRAALNSDTLTNGKKLAMTAYYQYYRAALNYSPID